MPRLAEGCRYPRVSAGSVVPRETSGLLGPLVRTNGPRGRTLSGSCRSRLMTRALSPMAHSPTGAGGRSWSVMRPSVRSGRWSGLQGESLRILGTVVRQIGWISIWTAVSALKARGKTSGPSPWPNVVIRSVGSGLSSYHRPPFGILPNRGDRAAADNAAAFDEGDDGSAPARRLAMKSTSDGRVRLGRDFGRVLRDQGRTRDRRVRELQLPAAFALGDHHSPIHVGYAVKETLLGRVW